MRENQCELVRITLKKANRLQIQINPLKCAKLVRIGTNRWKIKILPGVCGSRKGTQNYTESVRIGTNQA